MTDAERRQANRRRVALNRHATGMNSPNKQAPKKPAAAKPTPVPNIGPSGRRARPHLGSRQGWRRYTP